MPIDPKAEKPARALLGHAIRGDWNAYATCVEQAGEERFLEALSLCLRVAGYVAIDVSDHQWPSDADLREIAGYAAAAELGLGLTETAVRDYLAHCALGFEPLAHVFPDKEQAATIPVFATAALLVTYRRPGTNWWDYLDQVERALEEAAMLSRNAFPAALLLSRRSHALKNQLPAWITWGHARAAAARCPP
jgi:hypothetical protein